MESLHNQQNQPTRHVRSYNDPKERERLLMQYGGIFKNNIKEFGDVVVRKLKKQTNFSR